MYYIEVGFTKNKLGVGVGIYKIKQNYFDWQERNAFNIVSKIVSVNVPKSANKVGSLLVVDNHDNIINELLEAKRRSIEILFGGKYEK